MSNLKGEIVVVGGGLAGTSTAIGLAQQGFETILVAPSPRGEDRRSTALLGQSVSFLETLEVLERVRAVAEPLATMRIVDDTGRLLRAPTVEFRAGEIGLSAFGYNVLNVELAKALQERAAELSPRLRVVGTAATSLRPVPDGVEATLEDGTRVTACLAVGADGRRSIVRDGAGIAMREWSYPQTAIVLDFDHEVAHHGISTEFHTRTGPFTQVPMRGRRSSLVWVESPEAAALIVDIRPERLAEMVEERLHSILGKVTIEGPVQAFPLKGAIARAMTGERVALVGETAHVFPPIGAQGLNLGLRDAAALIDAVSTARDDPGRPSALARYAARRRRDVWSRTVGVDALNRSLLGDMLPVQALRAAGLYAMASSSLIRRFAMREGTAPGAGLFGLSEMLRASLAR